MRVIGLAAEDLLERQAETTELTRALAAARDGVGGLVVVEGPAGIGKSRLLATARAAASESGMAVSFARGTELERDAPFGVAADLFAGRLAAASREERAGLLSGQAALAASLFRPGAPAVQDPTAIVRGLYWLTAGLASAVPPGARGPAGLLIEVDDGQWVDRPTLRYLAFLAARIEELPVVLLITGRTGEGATDPATLEGLRNRADRVLTPRPLSPAAVHALVLGELPGADMAFTGACSEVSGGNPFFARELIRALHADGIAPTGGSVAAVRRLVPDSVLHSVLGRIARLGEPAGRLARSLAVLGDGTPWRRARQLAGLDGPTAAAAADALTRAHLLTDGDPLWFAHPLIASAVHTDLSGFARARAHAQAAELLAADGAPARTVAAHLLLTSPDADQPNVRILRAAAQEAQAGGDPVAATHLLTRALDEPPVGADRCQVLLELAEAETAHGNRDAVEHVDQACRLAEGPEARVAAFTALARLLFATGDHRAGAEAMDHALSEVDPADPGLAGSLATYLSLTTFRSSLRSLADERLQPIVGAARRGEFPAHPGLAAHLCLRLAFAAEPPARIRSLAEAATAADPLIDPATHGILMGVVVQALCAVDELDCAKGICDAALAAAARRGSLLGWSTASYSRAIARYHRGELSDALADLDQATEAGREGWTAGAPWHGALLVHIHLERGDLTAAHTALTMTTGAGPDTMDLAIVLFARARLALAEGRPAEALADAESSGRILLTGFGIDHPGFIPWRQTAAIAAHALRRWDHARTLSGELAERARWAGTARALGLALRTQAAIADEGDRVPLLTEAVAVLEQSPSDLQRAHALVELGAAHRRAGRRSAAQPPLRAGLQLADRMGAISLTEAARHELHATGARPRRSASTGPDALTPMERRVAELAGGGRTNPQIAQALFVTAKTVETHLAHGYRKLGIDSRHDLPGALTREQRLH